MDVLESIADWLRPTPPLPEHERAAIERLVARVDPRLRLVPDYQKHLLPAVRQALAYTESLVAALPGPVDVHAGAFGRDPIVHAFFATPDNIVDTLGRSQEVREFLAAPRNQMTESFYGLLGARRREKKVLGMSLYGEVVAAEIPQTLLYFADHTLRAVAADLDDTRGQLQLAGLDSLADGFAAQREAADRHSVPIAATLDELVAWLMAPEDHLRLEPVSVTVDLLGVETSEPTATTQQISFPELVGQDRRRWTLVLARMNRDEALAAIQRQQQAIRYMII